VVALKFSCTLKCLINGHWVVRHAGPALATVEVTAPTREAALTKMRNELRYRVELCPCSGVSDDYVELQITEDSGQAGRNPGIK
jgi:hypothetical protein